MIDGNHETKIGPYTCTLVLSTECGLPHSNCYIECGQFSGSLECADGEGELQHSFKSETHPISDWYITRIRNWAEALGY